MGTIQYETLGRASLTSQKVWRTLIVDDHPLFRDGLRELLMTMPDFQIVGEAEREEQSFQQFLATDPDLITVDISLVSGSGLSLISRIKARKPSAVVLAISMYEDRVYAERALAAGASGYVCKQADSNELKSALQAVQRGEIYVSASFLQRMLIRKGAAAISAAALKDKQLSSRELEIFNLIGRGRTTHQIARELSIAVSTVETYRERLKTKLNLSSGAELTRHAILCMMQNA
jgi:DNA-binding NarL/FixJ family response regulator